MITAIVLAADGAALPEQVRETAVRSLAWLVSSVVEGVVRDVVMACPPDWPVVDIMDYAGCELVQADGESERLSAAVARARTDRVFVLRAGFQPDRPMTAEIAAVERRARADVAALLLEAPTRLRTRLFPDSAPVAGVMLSRRELLPTAPTFQALARRARGGVRFRARAVPVL